MSACVNTGHTALGSQCTTKLVHGPHLQKQCAMRPDGRILHGCLDKNTVGVGVVGINKGSIVRTGSQTVQSQRKLCELNRSLLSAKRGRITFSLQDNPPKHAQPGNLSERFAQIEQATHWPRLLTFLSFCLRFPPTFVRRSRAKGPSKGPLLQRAQKPKPAPKAACSAKIGVIRRGAVHTCQVCINVRGLGHFVQHIAT